jgi:lipopolysaccharide biosynthesis glycosyltransferase
MKTVIFTTFDQKYFFYAAVMVRTLSENYHGETPLDFACLVPESLLSKEDEFRLFVGNVSNLNIKFVNSPKFNEFSETLAKGNGYITKDVWHRIFIGSLFPDYDRAIQIDADALVARDIDVFLNYPQYNKFMAVMEMNIPSFITPDLENRAYFNAGIFAVDLNYWREAGIEEQILMDVKENGITPLLEQDALNRVLTPVLSPLPVAFNVSFMHVNWLGRAATNPVIMHFVGHIKPWNDHNQDDIWTIIWRKKYNRMLREYNLAKGK